MYEAIVLPKGSTVLDHRGREVEVSHLKALTASGRTVGYYHPSGALIDSITAPNYEHAVRIIQAKIK